MQSGAGRESSDQRPLLLFLCHPLTGHLTPTLRVAAALHARGWPVSFLGPTAHRDRILASGAAFFPLLASADIDDLAYYAASTREYRSLSWSERALVDVERQWYAPIPDQWSSLRAALSRLHRDDPARDVIVVCEAIFHGILPLFFGADLAQSPSGPDEAAVPSPLAVPRILGTLCLSVTVPLIRSADLPPFGFALPYDASPEGRARNAACWAAWAAHTTRLQGLLDEALRKAGATKPFDGVVLSGENYLAHARILQLGVPGFFYPRTDWPDKLQIVGLSPPPPTTSASLPSWWHEVARPTRKSGVRLVVVAQGTVETDPRDLILPTLRGLARRPDVVVVAILGRRGAVLPAHAARAAGPHARVVDYLNYDVVLPHADVWIHNAGFGAVTHGIWHGVPMVVGGEGQDKVENARRVAWCGAGVDLGTARPRAAAVRRAVEAVLDERNAYRKRALALQAEARAMDCAGAVEKAVEEVWKGRAPGGDQDSSCSTELRPCS